VFAFESFGDAFDCFFWFLTVVKEACLCFAGFPAFLDLVLHRGCDVGSEGLVCGYVFIGWLSFYCVIPGHHEWAQGELRHCGRCSQESRVVGL
jgi:hypothetical protein